MAQVRDGWLRWGWRARLREPRGPGPGRAATWHMKWWRVLGGCAVGWILLKFPYLLCFFTRTSSSCAWISGYPFKHAHQVSSPFSSGLISGNLLQGAPQILSWSLCFWLSPRLSSKLYGFIFHYLCYTLSPSSCSQSVPYSLFKIGSCIFVQIVGLLACVEWQ